MTTAHRFVEWFYFWFGTQERAARAFGRLYPGFSEAYVSVRDKQERAMRRVEELESCISDLLRTISHDDTRCTGDDRCSVVRARKLIEAKLTAEKENTNG